MFEEPDDDDDFEVPSVLKAVVNWDNEEEECDQQSLISHNVYPGILSYILLVSIPGFGWTASISKLRQSEDRGNSVASETGNLWDLNFQYVINLHLFLPHRAVLA
ncbi:hypothetical protein PsorP6_005576 [Peronosclerospora sorghi]|uniref:Uncharacterized protein n=1 Tax=Peronosclerospora sorghi TaxID=230839 RepID=A0ACC0W5B5_9STRA|nr:hypothetical protein PsorP6_005576 [Peronosclerospora sorghi]